MNPLKTLLNKVFETTPPADPVASPTDESSFEWNPDEETVAPTSSKATYWKRGDVLDESRKHLPAEEKEPAVAASDQDLPEVAPVLAPEPIHARVEPAPSVSAKPSMASAPVESLASGMSASVISQTPAAPARANSAPLIPLSDFEDVYRKAGIKSPVHGYGVERVYRLITSRRLVGLDRTVRRSALLTALDAAGVPASDVSQDAVLRRKALTAFEAEKALELQSLRSRNESRAEALQDTVQTFTRQKQSQIERLAQGSTAAVRSQSDLEIRKRMEQDRLFRSLAYFVEPLPTAPANLPPSRPMVPIAPRPSMIERFDATLETTPLPVEAPAEVTPVTAVAAPTPLAPVHVVTLAPPPDAEAESDAGTRPISLELAMQAAAQESRTAGWGKPAIVPDTAADPVEALRKLREAKKAEPES